MNPGNDLIDILGRDKVYLLPSIIADHPEFNNNDEMVFRRIFNHMINVVQTSVDWSDVTIGEKSKISSRTAARSIKILEQHGMLTRTYSSNRRTIHLGPVFKEWLIEANKVSEEKFEYLL